MHLTLDLLQDPDAAFHALLTEVAWDTMYHRGGPVPRLVAVQGAPASLPIYRHPADSSPPLRPFTPTVDAIRLAVEQQIGHSLNHVLIQHYRGGSDYISEHSDKTLDISYNTNIINVSLGAQRTMTLRLKQDIKPRPVQRIPLPHNSVFVLDSETNKLWLHGIKHDNRPLHTKSDPEKAFGGDRISLTFRLIATFLLPMPTTTLEPRYLIYGQGATSKDPDSAQLVPLPGEAVDEVSRVIRAFGEENTRGDSFDWETWYGGGFDVVHLASSE